MFTPLFFALRVKVCMDSLTRMLDWLYYDCISPLFQLIGRLLSLVLIQPLVLLHVPLWLHVIFIGVLTAWFSFFLRRLLKVEEKVKRFNIIFAEKRRRQRDLQLISDKYSREALYKVTDDELNSDFNTYLAHHYARYVTVYMLPVFLVLAWLNTVFTETMLSNRLGQPFVLNVPANSFGVTGLSVTFVFLLAYVLSLIVGFQILRRRKHR
jgi:uncharacterized membrane protein (DUF106 family)